MAGLRSRGGHPGRVPLGKQAVKLVRPNIHTISKRALVDNKLMGNNSNVPLPHQIRGQTATAVHHYRYVVLENQ